MKLIYYVENSHLDEFSRLLKALKGVECDATLQSVIVSLGGSYETLNPESLYFNRDVYDLWESVTEPIVARFDRYSCVKYIMDPQFEAYYDDVKMFLDSCIFGLGIPLLEPPPYWEEIDLSRIKTLLDQEQMLSEVSFLNVNGKHAYVIAITAYDKSDASELKLLTLEQETTLLYGFVASGLVKLSQLYIYTACDSGSGSSPVSSINELVRLLSGNGPYISVWGDGIYEYEARVIQHLLATIKSYAKACEGAFPLYDIAVATNAKGVSLLLNCEQEIDIKALKSYIKTSAIGRALDAIMKEVVGNVRWLAEESEAYQNIRFFNPEQEVESYESIIREERHGHPITSYQFGAQAKVIFAILRSEGLVEERAVVGKNAVERYVTPKGSKYGYNHKNENGGNTTYWDDELIEELTSLYLTEEKITHFKKLFKDGKIGQHLRYLHTMTKLLKDNGVKMSAVKANKILLERGVLVIKKRISQPSGVIKQFKALSQKGLEYGENRSSEYSSETTPYYYSDKFMALVDQYLL